MFSSSKRKHTSEFHIHQKVVDMNSAWKIQIELACPSQAKQGNFLCKALERGWTFCKDFRKLDSQKRSKCSDRFQLCIYQFSCLVFSWMLLQGLAQRERGLESLPCHYGCAAGGKCGAVGGSKACSSIPKGLFSFPSVALEVLFRIGVASKSCSWKIPSSHLTA